MRWMIDNATIWRDNSGNIKVDKRSRTAKVDGVSATINALALVLDTANQPTRSVYEERGLLIIGDSRSPSSTTIPEQTCEPVRREGGDGSLICRRCISQESGKKVPLEKVAENIWRCPQCGLNHSENDLYY